MLPYVDQRCVPTTMKMSLKFTFVAPTSYKRKWRLIAHRKVRLSLLSLTSSPKKAKCDWHPPTHISLNHFSRSGDAKVQMNMSVHRAGASLSRNHGLAESSADWVLFLDDDVIPDGDLLQHFADAIRTRGRETDGFVGTVEMPQPVNWFTRAVVMSHLTYCYDVGRKMERVSWGTTANLAVRRSALRFGDGFPKTGEMELQVFWISGLYATLHG